MLMTAPTPLSPVTRWLLEGVAIDAPFEKTIEELSVRLIEAGVPLCRLCTSLHTRHPEVFARMMVWDRSDGCEVFVRPHDIRSSPTYLNSPVAAIHAGLPELRLRLDGDRAAIPYPSLRDLAEDGATDYFVLPIPQAGGRQTFFSCTTDRPGGFQEEHLALIREVTPVLALRIALRAEADAIRSLLDVYLGSNASRRVLSGAVRRGAGEIIRAAIWFCDLRSFTELSDHTPVREVVSLLDQYFEAVSSPIVAAGGEILKFVGDAMLGIFPIHDDQPLPCGPALTAAEEALANLERLNARLSRPLHIGLALHQGEVMYGNIGAQSRLDFTVIGASVNEVCRVESLCKPLGVPLLVTRAFAHSCATVEPRVVSLGGHQLKGVSTPIEVFTLHRFASSAKR
jgi:adenylate cyclase